MSPFHDVTQHHLAQGGEDLTGAIITSIQLADVNITLQRVGQHPLETLQLWSERHISQFKTWAAKCNSAITEELVPPKGLTQRTFSTDSPFVGQLTKNWWPIPKPPIVRATGWATL